MCFSPEADVTAGTIVAIIGIDAVRHVQMTRQIPLAVLPLLLAAHEFDEAFVWWGLRHQVSWSVSHAAIVLYLAFAFALPVLAPIAIIAIETNSRRRGLMICLLTVGAVVSAFLLTSVFHGSVSARIDGHHIAYTANVANGSFLAMLYILATCGTLLLSSDRRIVLFGASNVVAVMFLAWLTVGGLTSLWCTWAAITSISIVLYLRAPGGTDSPGRFLQMLRGKASPSSPRPA